ncbi:hypothetical protein F5Y00DRAFT_17895 [Daldinia vernicosa]|uniref:uncharacterized protein n=1 Tax=Daldinia vernicosa TaxID=114800 RepID=UPI0020088B33|nr:uncharacterized protein F5Y00DRAFT_17895 [Daldinia vernicosa]KAI0851238.1 hypothetical protein F5Y00DRAFT_17895 [Daldinia vernicosa]
MRDLILILVISCLGISGNQPNITTEDYNCVRSPGAWNGQGGFLDLEGIFPGGYLDGKITSFRSLWTKSNHFNLHHLLPVFTQEISILVLLLIFGKGCNISVVFWLDVLLVSGQILLCLRSPCTIVQWQRKHG